MTGGQALYPYMEIREGASERVALPRSDGGSGAGSTPQGVWKWKVVVVRKKAVVLTEVVENP
jgi:hypothetical protein